MDADRHARDVRIECQKLVSDAVVLERAARALERRFLENPPSVVQARTLLSAVATGLRLDAVRRQYQEREALSPHD
jgi:hypothetical protein